MTHRDPDRHDAPSTGNVTGYAAIKYTAVVIIVLAILAFLVWGVNRFVF